jgi:hypothetical protein
MSIAEEILSIAEKWVGQEEIRGNQGFKDSEFEAKMKACGWKKGESWCSYFSEIVWKEAYQRWDATMFTRLDKLFSGGAITTFRNFQKTKDFIVDIRPTVGSLVVWQNYKEGTPHWTGHIGIVSKVDMKNKSMNTIEGNTNDNGEREGFEVANKTRAIDFTLHQNGLVLLGFVHPKDI